MSLKRILAGYVYTSQYIFKIPEYLHSDAGPGEDESLWTHSQTW